MFFYVQREYLGFLLLFYNRKLHTRSARYNKLEQRKVYQCQFSGDAATSAHQPPRSGDEEVEKDTHVVQKDKETDRITKQTSSSALITGKQYSSEDYEGIIRDLKRLNAKQASEVHEDFSFLNKRGYYWVFLMTQPSARFSQICPFSGRKPRNKSFQPADYLEN